MARVYLKKKPIALKAMEDAIAAVRPTKPVSFAGLGEGAEIPADHVAGLRAAGVPYFPAPCRAFRALAALRKETPVRAAAPNGGRWS